MKRLRSGILVPDDCPPADGRSPSLILVHLEIGPVTREGRPLAPPYRQWSHSWTKQMAQLINTMMRMTADTAVKDTGGTLRTSSTTASPPLDCIAGAGGTVEGIEVGTGTTAESADDYVLAAKIAEGSGAGQLNYQASVGYAIEAVTGGYRITLDRQLNNNSGGTIVIAEMGLVAQHTASAFMFLILRDVLSSTYSLATGAAAVARYKIDFLV